MVIRKKKHEIGKEEEVENNNSPRKEDEGREGKKAK